MTSVYSYLACLVGYLADVDFGSEKLRFIGGARFDVYGAYQLIAHKPIRAKISIDDQSIVMEGGGFNSFHSISVINMKELSAGFVFDKPGVSAIPSTQYLLPFVLKPTCNYRLPQRISIELETEAAFSIDGEKYKAKSVYGERIDNSGVYAPW